MRDDAFEALRTDRSTVRRFRRQDAPALSAYRADPEVARSQTGEPCTSDQAVGLVDALAGLAPGTPGEWFQFAVALSGSQELIGDCALRCTRSQPTQTEIGFTFARSFQGGVARRRRFDAFFCQGGVDDRAAVRPPAPGVAGAALRSTHRWVEATALAAIRIARARV